MPQPLFWRRSRAELLEKLRLLPGMAAGRVLDPHGLSEGLALRLGMVALQFIRHAFVVKARGGTDEAGEKWKPLAPSTIARRRLGPKDKKALTLKERLSKLSPDQQKAVRRKLRDKMAEFRARGLDAGKAQALARAQVFREVRKAGGVIPTRHSILANRTVEILRDTGILLSSLMPAVSRGGVIPPTPGAPPEQKPDPAGQRFNVLLARPGRVTLGTNVPYAPTHHRGRGHVPQRRLWPEVNRWPTRWWNALQAETLSGLIRMAELLVSAA